MVTGARRRALRDGDRQIDTAHLLHSLLESDPEVRAAFDGGPQLARLLGYLVQRSIGYGLRWQGAVEDSGAVPVVPEPGVDGWSPVGRRRDGRRAASGRNCAVTPRAGGLDLLAALGGGPGVPGRRGAGTGRCRRGAAARTGSRAAVGRQELTSGAVGIASDVQS